MTLSGANADTRVPCTAADQLKIVTALTGGSASGLPENIANAVNKAKAHLKKAGNKGVVITGLQNVAAQTAVLNCNEGSEVMDADHPKMIAMGSTSEVNNVMNGVISGSVKGLITVGVNPVYSFPNAAFAEAYKNLDLSLAFAMKEDETASLANMVAATPHYLESWGDVQLKKGSFSLVQPTIRPLFDTKQFQDCLVKWTANGDSYYNYLRDMWSSTILADGGSWNQALQDGVIESAATVSTDSDTSGEIEVSTSNAALAAPMQGGLELTLYTKTAMGDGQQANNPWLQDLPDPLTRASWDNYLTVSAKDAAKIGLENFHVANGGLNGSYVNVRWVMLLWRRCLC